MLKNIVKPFYNSICGINMNVNATYSDDDIIYRTIFSENGDYPEEMKFNGWKTRITHEESIYGYYSLCFLENEKCFSIMKSPSEISLEIYDNITGYIKKNPKKKVILYFSKNSDIVGNEIDIRDYVDNDIISDGWRKFTIPLNDLNVNNEQINHVNIRCNYPKKSFFIDKIQLIGTAKSLGGSKIFSVYPDDETVLYIDSIESTWIAQNCGKNINWDGFLNIPRLKNGILIKFTQNAHTSFNVSFKNIFDTLSYITSRIVTFETNGLDSIMKLSTEFHNPLVFKSYTQDKAEIIIQDNLSQLLGLRMMARCRYQNIEGSFQKRFITNKFYDL